MASISLRELSTLAQIALLRWRRAAQALASSGRARAAVFCSALAMPPMTTENWHREVVDKEILAARKQGLASNCVLPAPRAGAVSTAFLVALEPFLPVTLLRRTDLKRRVGQVPRRLVLALVIATLAASSAASTVYLWAPVAFI
jgi:hypothetical protein